jgi:adenylyl-sulfate kinase
MKIRKVNLKTIFTKTIIYRLFIIFVQAFFTYLYIKNIQKCFQISIGWNLVNCCLYYIYEYLFSKKYDTTIQTKGFVLWFTGLPCSGKTTLADAVRDELLKKGINVERLDGDIVRKEGLSDDLRFSKEDRDKNIRRVTFVAKVLSRNKTAVLASFVSPYRKTRSEIRKKVTNFIEVFVDCESKTCIKRDVKGMWKKAQRGEIKNFTGWDDPYERPINPEIISQTDIHNVKKCTKRILNYLKQRKLI